MKYSIGHQDFRKIREEGFKYVDKTEHICRLIENGGYLFLSRPRRFGKSLTVSTMNELYSGSEELFKGLWAGEHWNFKDKQRPVIWLKFSSIDYENLGVTAALLHELHSIIDRRGIKMPQGLTLKLVFRELLFQLAQSSPSGKVVLLIDEYDKPIIDYIDDIPKAEANRDALRAFYAVLKDADPYLELVFITGVSAFSKVSLFSDLNNLDNLTLSPEAYTLVGITQQELEDNFGPQLDASGYTRAEVRRWYNGYAWGSHERVYNPWSILKFLKKRELDNYWAESGTPTFVTKLLTQHADYNVAPTTVRKLDLTSFNLAQLNPVAILFQAGYLTVKEVMPATGQLLLDYPNEEVRQTFLYALLGEYGFGNNELASTRINRLYKAFCARDLDTIIEIINVSLAAVPHQLWQRQSEAMVHAIIHTTFTVLGLYTRSEVSTSRGRADIGVEVPKYVYILELKLGGTAAEAMAQIETRGFGDAYTNGQQEVVKIGIAFDVEERLVGDWMEGG